MKNLNTQVILTSFPAHTQPYNVGSKFGLEIPAPDFMLAKPLTYEFRVAEHCDEHDNVTKVGLQVKTYEVDQYGNQSLLCDWTDVERVKVKA